MTVAGIAGVIGLAAMALSSCQTPAPSDSPAPIDESRIVDLTYPFDEHTVNWPTAKPFEWKKETWGVSPGGYWYAAGHYAASEHLGTHLDSPIHFAEHGATTDQIPVSRLVGPAVVIDIRAASAQDPDYRLTVEDLARSEKTHGAIPEGAIVLVRTGWGQFWPDKKRYLGTDAPGDVANLHFPGLSREAAEWLASQRKVDGVGIDTASIDHGPSRDFIAHRILSGANIYALENVANLETLPERGATLLALPMYIAGSSGAPVRIVALLP
jgi:kynurenine formamidase